MDPHISWAALSAPERDDELGQLTGFAKWFDTQLLLLARPAYVAVVKLYVAERHRGRGNARTVMGELVTWADELGVTLGITPSTQWGADPARLARFYTSLGFTQAALPLGPLQVTESLYRHRYGLHGAAFAAAA